MKKTKIVNTWTRFDDVYASYYDDKGIRQSTRVNTPWYFAIDKKDKDAADKVLKESRYLYEIKIDEKFPEYVKVFCQNGQTYKKTDIVLLLETNGIKTYEGDLRTDKRFYIDREIEVSDRYEKLYFDIETDDSLEAIEIGRDRILSFGAIDSHGKKYFTSLSEFTDEAEVKLLTKAIKLMGKYDIVLGWNSSQFDMPYIRIRAFKLNTAENKLKTLYYDNIKTIAHYDLLKRFRHIFRFDNHIKKFNLNFISNYFLGRGKIDHSGEKIIDLYRNNKKKLEEYNLEDCVLVKDLDDKLGVSAMMIRQCQWCGVPASQFGLYAIIDAYILKMAHQLGKFGHTSRQAIQERNVENVLGDNPSDTDEKSKYLGAIVLEPKIGKYERVYTFDFKSLYPSMMRTSNIGYDTLRNVAEENCITNPGTFNVPRRDTFIKPTYFIKEPSVINLAITNLLQKRTEYKKLKLKMIEEGTNHGPDWDRVVSDEIIVKELSNSTYGIMGLEYGRYFDIDIAESITLFGQWVILYSQKYFNKIGYDVIYGDTDSVFVSVGNKILDLDEELKKFHEQLKIDLHKDYNIDETFIQLEFDKQYESLILIAKKSYVGHVVNIEGKKTDDTYARGLEFIKKNTFSFASDKQKILVDMLLHKKIQTTDEIRKWVKETKEEFDSKEFTKEELTLTQKVGKPIDQYTTKTPPLHVRLAKALQEKTNQVFTNVEIDYIITDASKGMNGVLSEEFDGTFARDYYWSNKTQPVLERITGVAFPDVEIFETIKSPKIVRIAKTRRVSKKELKLLEEQAPIQGTLF